MPSLQVGNYKIHLDTCLGRGGFGEVFLATDSNDNRLACKITYFQFMNRYLKGDQSKINQHFREISVMAQLKHPNLVEMKEYILIDKKLYIFMEYCNGGNLRNHFYKFSKRFPNTIENRDKYEQFALDVFQNISDALKYLYQKSIVHRDIKMENILIQGGKCKLADFGLAKFLIDVDKELMQTRSGTPLYKSPQLLIGQLYNSKSDVWAFGIMMYEITLGESPFRGNSERDLYENIVESIRQGKFERQLYNIQNRFLQNLIKKMIIELDLRKSWNSKTNTFQIQIKVRGISIQYPIHFLQYFLYQYQL
ncbi:hypothetical protein pb186bvf_006073 [Paramecium bursaria]